MTLFNEMEETRARLGAGSALYSDFFSTDDKFQLLVPTVETPFIGKDVAEIEVKVSSSSTVTKINGVETLNAVETNVYMHRDCARLLEKLDGKTIEIISMAGDMSGYRYSAAVTYTPSNATMDDAWQGTIKLTPKTKPTYVDNCYPLIKPTALFKSAIEPVVYLDTTTSTYELDIEMKPTDATFTATSEAEAVATAAVSGSKLTITGKKEGSTMITLKSNKEGYASWETTILVIVPATATVLASNTETKERSRG